jgi:hypothetical protein
MTDAVAADAEDGTVAELLDALDAAAGELAAASEAREERGPDTVERVTALHEEVLATLARYEERATDWDDFEGYAELRKEMSRHVEDCPEDLPEAVRDAVEDADDALVTGRVAETLDAEDFGTARAALAPLEAYAEVEERYAEARERYRGARRRVARRRDTLGERVAELEELAAFTDADLGADLDPVREPVEAYDRAVAADLEALREDVPAREALATLDAAAGRPLVELPRPPEDLLAYVTEHPAGEESLATLAEWAAYSPSKLDHYVADADAFRRAVGTRQGYLDRVGPDPFQVGWPPPPADRLRWCCRERESAIRRFAEAETVARLRAVRTLPERTDYAPLRRAAVAGEELDEDDRRLLREGRVEGALETAREECARLEAGLAEHPPIADR